MRNARSLVALGAVLSLLGCAEERANPLNAPVGVGGEPTDGRVGAGGEAGGVGERPGPGARGDGAGGGPGSPEGGVPYAEGGDEPYVDPGDGRPDICPDGSARSLDGECSDLHLPDPIRVESVLPASGPVQGGTLVTIVGAGFIRPTEVFVAGQPISVDPVRHEGELRFPTPDVSDLGILGPVDIEIRNEAGNFTLAGGFNYFDQVRLDSLSVDHGTTAGGDSIRIHGGGFDDSLVVAFGRRTAADVRVLSAEQAQVISPPGPAGAVDVRAFTDSGQALLADAFTYVTPVRLDTVLPRSGPLEGGTVVTLSGDGFTPDATVYVGNRQAAVLGVSEDRRTLTASTPRVDDPGARNVRVVSAGGEARLIGAFSYVDPDDPALVVHSVVPPAGSTSRSRTRSSASVSPGTTSRPATPRSRSSSATSWRPSWRRSTPGFGLSSSSRRRSRGPSPSASTGLPPSIGWPST